MAQWINVFRNNGFVNPTRLPLLCEKTGALAIVEPGLTAGWSPSHSGTGSYGSPAGRPLGRRICCKARKFKLCIFDF